MPYCEISYHLVWATANREPLIDSLLESRLHRYMQKKALNLGAIVFAVNGAPDHVHMVVSVPPKLPLADFVGKVKGVSSHDVSRDLERRFRWQATKCREPMIEPRIESQLRGYMQAKAIELGATVFAFGGMPDHVHMVASVPPKVALADFISQVKGFSAHEIRDHERRFRWQSEYGLFPFDRKRLPRYVAYVENQKRHHAEGATRHVLERTSDSGSEIREQMTPYDYGADEWRRELEAWDDEHPRLDTISSGGFSRLRPL